MYDLFNIRPGRQDRYATEFHIVAVKPIPIDVTDKYHTLAIDGGHIAAENGIMVGILIIIGQHAMGIGQQLAIDTRHLALEHVGPLATEISVRQKHLRATKI